MKLKYCKRCGRIGTPLGMRAITNEALGLALAKELFSSKCRVKVRSFEHGNAKVEVEGYKVDEDSINFPLDLEVAMIHEICQDDYRRSSGYYEAIVQIRGNADKAQRLFKRIDKFLAARGAFIGKVETKELTGMDLYVSDKALLNDFMKRTKTKSKRSYTLYSVKGGKRIFRNTYLVEL